MRLPASLRTFKSIPFIAHQIVKKNVTEILHHYLPWLPPEISRAANLEMHIYVLAVMQQGGGK